MRSGVPQKSSLAEGLYRSTEGEAKAAPKRLKIWLLSLLAFYFGVFIPKIACQAPKPPKPFPSNNIDLAYQLPSIRYTEYIDRRQSSPGQHPGLSY
jgi:hypothetical protein